MWFIDDINWYDVMLMFMIMSIENDVVIEDDIDRDDVGVYDNIDMKWCCYWWLCWYEIMLLLLIMSLRWDDIDVENDIEMRYCWCWKVIVMMCDVCVHGGCSDHDEYPWYGNKVVKNF